MSTVRRLLQLFDANATAASPAKAEPGSGGARAASPPPPLPSTSATTKPSLFRVPWGQAAASTTTTEAPVAAPALTATGGASKRHGVALVGHAATASPPLDDAGHDHDHDQLRPAPLATLRETDFTEIPTPTYPSSGLAVSPSTPGPPLLACIPESDEPAMHTTTTTPPASSNVTAPPTPSAETSPLPINKMSRSSAGAGGPLPGKGVNYLDIINRRTSDTPMPIIITSAAAHERDQTTSNSGSPFTSSPYASRSGSLDSTSSFLDVLQAGGHDRETLAKRLSKRLSFSYSKAPTSALYDQSIFTPEILGRYSILEKLGTGGYADVFKVKDRSDNSLWALKVIYKNRVKNQKRLDQEIEALKRAQHPNIVCLRETIMADEQLYLRQDLASGGCLFDLLLDMGGFGEAKTALVMKHILEAVGYLHSIGIVHRDIKLENVLLGKPNDLATVKLADFGMARIIQEGEHEVSNVRKRFRPVILSHVGSVAYMAPEIFLARPYDEAVDMWACGVMLFMLLSLSSPFGNDEDDPGAEQDQISRITKADFDFSDPAWHRRSESAKDLCRGLLKFDPNERLTAIQALQHPWILEHCPNE